MFSKASIKKSTKELAAGSTDDDHRKALEYLRDLRSKYFLENLNTFFNKIKELKLSVSGRLKRFDTIIRKVQRSSSDVNTMGDLIGYRIITHSYEELKKVCPHEWVRERERIPYGEFYNICKICNIIQ